MEPSFTFITETTTYVYARHPERTAVYVLVETRPRRPDETPTPLYTKTNGVWEEKPNGSFVWSPGAA
jgi:hypothetical protein